MKKLLLMCFVLISTIMLMAMSRQIKTINNDSFRIEPVLYDTIIKPTFDEDVLRTLELNKENFYAVCDYYDVKFPDIVYAQSILESGNFKSNIYNTRNNFLGLYDSRKHEFYQFEHWTDCLKGYKKYIQYKYKDGDYYRFLDSIGYAEDENYVNLVKQIERRVSQA